MSNRQSCFALLLIYLPQAQVSATASPVSNSSGSVVNQAGANCSWSIYEIRSWVAVFSVTEQRLNVSPVCVVYILLAVLVMSIIQEPVYDNSDNFGLD